MKVDRRFRTDGRVARVLHVPLTPAEFEAFHDLAHERRTTKGELASAAIRAAYPITPKERQK